MAVITIYEGGELRRWLLAEPITASAKYPLTLRAMAEISQEMIDKGVPPESEVIINRLEPEDNEIEISDEHRIWRIEVQQVMRESVAKTLKKKGTS